MTDCLENDNYNCDIYCTKIKDDLYIIYYKFFRAYFVCTYIPNAIKSFYIVSNQFIITFNVINSYKTKDTPTYNPIKRLFAKAQKEKITAFSFINNKLPENYYDCNIYCASISYNYERYSHVFSG